MNLYHQVTNNDIPAISGQVQDVSKEGKEVSTRLWREYRAEISKISHSKRWSRTDIRNSERNCARRMIS